MSTPLNGSAVTLTQTQKKQLSGPPLSNAFDWGDRLFASFDGASVFDYGPSDARDLKDMLGKDGTARSLEQVLTLPLRGADWEIRAVEGDNGEAEFVRDQLGPRMETLLGQMTGAAVYRKAFFETSWDLDGERVVLADVGWRPPQACEAAFDTRTGRPDGFRKRRSMLAGGLVAREGEREDRDNPGYVRIGAERAFIYTHGTHREPLLGLSDMDISYWAWSTQQKVLFLWCQFLEGQSLPKVAAYGDGPDEAQVTAQAIADAKASGVIPMVRRAGEERPWDVIESAGRGADQFVQALRYLDGRKTQSVLASFTELAVNASQEGRGSNALSMDQSEFYLVSRQAVANEMAAAVNTDLIPRLVKWNFGDDAALPWLKIGPLSRRNTDRALEMLGNVITASSVNAPPDFTSQLLTSTASYLGLDTRRLEKAITDERQQADARQALAGADPAASSNGAAGDAEMGTAVNLSHRLVAAAQSGVDPSDALAGLTGGGGSTAIALAGAEQERKTGGMVALVPDEASAKKLVVGKPGAEKQADLHVTLLFLGEDVTGWSEQTRQRVVGAARNVARSTLHGPVEGRAWSHATFNPDGGRDGDKASCAVYLIGAAELPGLQEKLARKVQRVLGEQFQEQHSPYVAHATAGYGLTAADLDFTGPVRFDRVVVTLAGQTVEIPLGAADTNTSS